MDNFKKTISLLTVYFFLVFTVACGGGGGGTTATDTSTDTATGASVTLHSESEFEKQSGETDSSGVSTIAADTIGKQVQFVVTDQDDNAVEGLEVRIIASGDNVLSVIYDPNGNYTTAIVDINVGQDVSAKPTITAHNTAERPIIITTAAVITVSIKVLLVASAAYAAYEIVDGLHELYEFNMENFSDVTLSYVQWNTTVGELGDLILAETGAALGVISVAEFYASGGVSAAVPRKKVYEYAGTKLALLAKDALKEHMITMVARSFVGASEYVVGESTPVVVRIYYWATLVPPHTYGIVVIPDFNAIAPPTAPDAPMMLSAAAGDGQVTLNWATVFAADEYRVYWSRTPGVTTSGNYIRDITSTSLTHNNLPKGYAYYYRVQALTNGMGSDLSTEVSAEVAAQNGAISGSIEDATGAGIAGVSITVKDWGGNTLASGTSASGGNYSITVREGEGHVVSYSYIGYTADSYTGIDVDPAQTTYLETVTMIPEGGGQGGAGGTITSALTGVGISGLTVKLRSGINTYAGTVVTSSTTGSGGVYWFSDLNSGVYTVEISGDGYTTTYFTLICVANLTTSEQNSTISPTLSSGEKRIVLTWGASPSDLDSHLTGPTSSGGRFHVYYANQQATGVALDVDDVTSYGPETITISSQLDGTYRYSVHDYSNISSSSSSMLAASGAQVKLYIGGNLIRTFNVPNEAGTLWTVFEMSGNTITAVNSMSYQTSSGSITKPSLLEEDFPIDLAKK